MTNYEAEILDDVLALCWSSFCGSLVESIIRILQDFVWCPCSMLMFLLWKSGRVEKDSTILCLISLLIRITQVINIILHRCVDQDHTDYKHSFLGPLLMLKCCLSSGIFGLLLPVSNNEWMFHTSNLHTGPRKLFNPFKFGKTSDPLLMNYVGGWNIQFLVKYIKVAQSPDNETKKSIRPNNDVVIASNLSLFVRVLKPDRHLGRPAH